MFKFLFKNKEENPTQDFTESELNRLNKLPRYTPFKTKLFEKSIYSNDAPTLISDVKEILRKEIYRFESQNDDPVIIDCGANIGISIIYFKTLYPKSRIYGYEADPNLFELLEKNIKSFSFSDVILSQQAVWVDDEGVIFRKEGGHSGAIIEGKVESNSDLPVPSIRLKNQLEALDRIDLLKMDIEGAENQVLFDCGSHLGKCEHVFVEYHSKSAEPQQLHDMLKLFHDLGYRYHVKEAFTRSQPFVDVDVLVGMDLQLNLFFVKQR